MCEHSGQYQGQNFQYKVTFGLKLKQYSALIIYHRKNLCAHPPSRLLAQKKKTKFIVPNRKLYVNMNKIGMKLFIEFQLIYIAPYNFYAKVLIEFEFQFIIVFNQVAICR